MTTIEIRRITTGPILVIEEAERLVLDFIRTDPSSAAADIVLPAYLVQSAPGYPTLPLL